jgi:hypothetical protein
VVTRRQKLRRDAIFDHWLAGETTTEIAKKVQLPHQHIVRIIQHARAVKREGMCITETPPVYNVWNCTSCDPRFGQNYPGRIPGQAIVNL